jgi:hypothetical protein
VEYDQREWSTKAADKLARCSYKAPKGYVPSSLSEDLLSCFGADSLGGQTRKELWCIKIPDGISPAQLDGLALEVPDDTNAHFRGTLAQIEIDRQIKKAGSSSFKQHYTLRLRRRAPSQTKRHGAAASTQLIAMAEGSASLEGRSAGEDADENDEMHTLLVLLPDRGHAGRYVQASLPLKHHMQLVLNQPAQGSRAGARPSKEIQPGQHEEQKKVRAQPWDKMTGYYDPTGSLFQDEEIAERPFRRDDQKEESSPRKKSKKDKADHASSKKSKKDKADHAS